MSKKPSPFTRRSFLKTSAVAAVGAASLPKTFAFTPPQTAKYVRYDVTSDRGKRALYSYIKGIHAMLQLPPTHAHNWFRNAFVHLMDCPHGNWWFWMWHRGYCGYFEETIRNLSGDTSFAMPYWDWTTVPKIPATMFDDVLTPKDQTYARYTLNLDVFTSFIQSPLLTYWNSLSIPQRDQLKIRKYFEFKDLWNDVTGNGSPPDMCFATTDNARYLTRENPDLDPYTAGNCTPDKILAGLEVLEYYDSEVSLSFSSTKTPSHMTPPGESAGTQFAQLEGLPHNKVHNYIGGVRKGYSGPYGNMTNFLSPVDPIFHLHHANLDRLWDVWTRKQQRLGKPIFPTDPEVLKTLSDELFMFFVNGEGKFVPPTKASEYFSMKRFDYEYQPGFPENLLETINPLKKHIKTQARGKVKGNSAALSVTSAAIKEHLAAPAATLIAEVTVPHSASGAETREFHVLVGAPEGVTEVDPKSPFFAGTLAFFGGMHGHGMGDVTFAIPLPKTPQAFKGLAATNATVDIRIVPADKPAQPVLLKSATIRAIE
jgi:tyrosinase